ncbi:NAD(+)--dinitrogen-reductase ADP-D-ribosyltransferase [Magnetococcus marinus MC-1]|uniref:NAD(+)--dinitrogen-reductase ADP-D-ribosyltransferase n=1 Tax=Magnetococcus marinus (strain ATCC BAA-1437 / JCM 17883 / MC-1) TaxID=156889 RepID=A0L6X1_MAGMM|nr:NAD(+)--dinitrogen-reductase ADP-D-ribosyltransferase [Magnetococcus marinus]ABK43714.1 NAD(+)--dinitrogen-reductase ADP-D-ribosyltransferase [Magnetococcus marinus MC-1]
MRQTKLDCKVLDNWEGLEIELPSHVQQRFNRCNLTADILGSLAYQKHPVPLQIVGTADLHHRLFKHLDTIKKKRLRAEYFQDYMTVHFTLEAPEEAGYTPGSRYQRIKTDYRRILRGWLFNPDGREAAVIKGWVLSRFGLLPRWHDGVLDDCHSPAYQKYLQMQANGLYNTNALESQLDMVYAYCQYELKKRFPGQIHWMLYRGVNTVDQYEILAKGPKGRHVVLLNNLNSFTEDRDRADEFGDYIMEMEIPFYKVFCYNALFPGLLKGEEEVMVVGGLYDVRICTV